MPWMRYAKYHRDTNPNAWYNKPGASCLAVMGVFGAYAFIHIGVPILTLVLLACCIISTCSGPTHSSQSGYTTTRSPQSVIATATSARPAPSATLRVRALPSPTPRTYTVAPGDNLSRIAKCFGCSVSELVQANAIANPDVLQVGQVLIIPCTPSSPGLGTQTTERFLASATTMATGTPHP